MSVRPVTETENGAPVLDRYYAFEEVRKIIEDATARIPLPLWLELRLPDGILDYSEDAKLGVLDAVAWCGCNFDADGLIQRQRDVPL